MKSRRLITIVIALLLISLGGAKAQYVPDILPGYLRWTIHQPDDYEGKVVCTLVKKPQLPNAKKAIFYIHGYNDYFFQSQLGDTMNAKGYNFYAMDLRKYGRSILPNQNPFFCKSLKEYFADIDTALAIIKKEGNEQIIMIGHSTGGLINSYYLNERKGEAPVDGLILNSPFLDWNFGWFMENIVMPTVSFVGRIFPYITVQGLGEPYYGWSLLKQYKGNWEYNTDWKMLYGHPIKSGWITAIQTGQQAVQKHSDLGIPILVMSSNHSFHEGKEWNNEYRVCDIVLSVLDIQKYGAKLGSNVTRDTIPNGIHDLILSEKPSRDHTYKVITDWLDKYFGNK
jgi:alpha-beta hydrolase superfamily lysophospholipase